MPAATGNAERATEPTAGSGGATKAASALSVADDVAAAAETLAGNDSAPHPQPGTQVGILTVVADGGASPLGPPWQEVMTHISDRLSWTDPAFRMQVRTEGQLLADPAIKEAATKADIVFCVGVRQREAVGMLQGAAQPQAVLLAFDSDFSLETASRLQGYRLMQPPLTQQLLEKLPFGPAKKAAAAGMAVRTFWKRATSDDLLYMFLTVINTYFAEVPLLQSMRAQDPATIFRMVQKCGPQIFACVNDPDCKAALDCLQACDPTDQVCSYQCIVSYESQLLEDFSLCILEKNNCLGMNAERPHLPDVQPMTTFQGAKLTHELAERVFIGWLGKERYSWRVIAGANTAYDKFPCQYQIYYPQKRGKVFWYDPVFKVQKLDGTEVWRRRHYRVRRAEVPGTFHLSVLDNGVTSREFWRIVDCTDDLAWALFYYAGAASAAGQSYSGAVLVSRDGAWPAQDQRERLTTAFDAAGMKDWEMFRVNNRNCDGAPLDLPDIAKQPNPADFAWS